MNLMSSIAKTFVGSLIAIVSVAPEWLTGIIMYFCAMSPGTSLTTTGSIWKSARLIDGMPYCLLSRAVIS